MPGSQPSIQQVGLRGKRDHAEDAEDLRAQHTRMRSEGGHLGSQRQLGLDIVRNAPKGLDNAHTSFDFVLVRLARVLVRRVEIFQDSDPSKLHPARSLASKQYGDEKRSARI